MMFGSRISRFFPNDRKSWGLLTLVAVISICTLIVATPALAHHPLGGRLPSNFFEGFLSGLGHPTLGFDHFTFIVAVGAIAATKTQGVLIPLMFVLTAMLGGVLHLAGINLPIPELLIAASVLIFGIFLGVKDSPKTGVILSLVALAGIFHGYAYGEAIFGAEMTPVVAYLAGFTTIQLVVAFIAFSIARTLMPKNAESSPLSLRFAGWAIAGIGLSFLSTQILEMILPGSVG
jgi:urease accessory protein